MLFYALTIALSSFLLFEVQPVIAKMILPWFGGSSAVWSTCMLFFQLVLLLGYVYAHTLNKLKPRKQAVAHISLLAISLALLTLTVGLPYFLLSSTSPLLQAWYARTHSEGLPYRLFALSNFSSMLALLSYPFLIEPNLPSHTQAFLWSGAFVAFALLCAITVLRSLSGSHDPIPGGILPLPAAEAVADPPLPLPAPTWTARFLWLGLAAAPSVLLLAVTTHLTQDVAAIPFLWILPLAVYLLSFIVCFESPRLYHRAAFVPLLVLSLAFMAYSLSPNLQKIDLRLV